MDNFIKNNITGENEMENKYTKLADNLIEVGIKSKQDLMLASELKTMSANHLNGMRRYNGRLCNTILEHLASQGFMRNSTFDIPIIMLAEAMHEIDNLFWMMSSKKRQALVDKHFPEIKQGLTIGKTAYIGGYSRNIDMGKTGTVAFCFMQVVSNITSYQKYIICKENEKQGTDFCREENTFSCTVVR